MAHGSAPDFLGRGGPGFESQDREGNAPLRQKKIKYSVSQVRFLQEQARKVLEDARLSSLLHATSCNFKKIPGTTYYVYKQRKNPDLEFISMISPQVRTICKIFTYGWIRIAFF